MSVSAALQTLPADVLSLIFQRLDFRSLCNLSETNSVLHALASSESTWRHITTRRFRVNTNAQLPRPLALSGNLSWRTLFSNWHAQRRMPISRTTGPTFTVFAKGDPFVPQIQMWICVSSADDCRLRDGALRLRLVVQNISEPCILLQPSQTHIAFTEGGCICPQPPSDSARTLTIVQIACESWHSNEPSHRLVDTDKPLFLELDEFAVIVMDLRLADTVFEVDVLERLEHVRIPVITHCFQEAVAPFLDGVIWEAYEFLPGGWWVRRA
ncbi:hypothetical protein BWQ96_08653 [Gracilariopsis chorda]|uniref:F-box domain-containing protein n=1 Tax=Gracilariopsis chorda TaxID=448386 RepID=A0A2V3IHU7_9FLOR|nr:hypothetical protein BWQ96_08653 [Gracilariopsis chorda]|eukprot:PXF41642.1 hypothetical protein BWQ96_08653 [Gracilariopsis chorda]